MTKLINNLHQWLAISLLSLLAVTAQAADTDDISDAELQQILAPVALYPDSVLTHLLIASTYPLEVVQATRWTEKNSKLSGEKALKEADKQNWDPSVKALVAFPDLLKQMNDDLDWTQQLGEAFLADEARVMASIQYLRNKAYDQGTLQQMQHVVAERERDIIILAPARPEVIYVPYYDTRVVYGNWWWHDYPPVYWHRPGVYYSNSPFYWGISVNVRPGFYFSVFDWHRHHVAVHHHYHYTPPRYYPQRHQHYAEARRWQHDTKHRRGVHYRQQQLNHVYHNRTPAHHNQENRSNRQPAIIRHETTARHHSDTAIRQTNREYRDTQHTEHNVRPQRNTSEPQHRGQRAPTETETKREYRVQTEPVTRPQRPQQERQPVRTEPQVTRENRQNHPIPQQQERAVREHRQAQHPTTQAARPTAREHHVSSQPRQHVSSERSARSIE